MPVSSTPERSITRLPQILTAILNVDLTDRIAFTLAAIVVFSQVLIPPAIGMADNGDFSKIIGRLSLRPHDETDAFFHYATMRYAANPQYYWNSGFISTETGLASVAVLAGKLLPGHSSFDIRFLGVLHSALFLTALALALPLFHAFQTMWRRILVALVIFIFGDVMYVAYYNSFYMDTAAFLFLLLAAVFFLRAWRFPLCKPSAPTFFLLCSCLFVLAKAQHAPLSIPLAFLALQGNILVAPSRPFFSRLIAIGSLAACGWFAFVNTPPGYTRAPLFTLIFFGLAPSAENAGEELRQLGLDDSYLRYRGMHAYSPGSPFVKWDDHWSDAFSRKTSYWKLGLFYLRHPSRAAYVLSTGLYWAVYQRPDQLGNFDKSAGYPPNAKSYRFSSWSTLKSKLFKDHQWFYLTAFVAMVAALALWRPDYAFIIGLTAAMALAIGAMTDAAEWTRHLFIFNFFVDFTFVCTVARLIHRLTGNHRTWRGCKVVCCV